MLQNMKDSARGFILLLLIAGYSLASWSSDSLLNLQVCDLDGEQAIPKIESTSDGGCFISWFDSRTGDYCLYLQRLNRQGEFLLPDNGLLVSDHSQMTWLTDYDLAVDENDNAILVFSDTRNTVDELDVSAYMIGSDGTFLWGADGICLSDTTISAFEPTPKVAVTDAGNCVFTWGRSGTESVLIFQRISPSGDKLWGESGILISDAAADLSLPNLVASGEDSVIVLWEKSTGSYPMQTIDLYTQKFSDLGIGIWGDTYIQIYNSGAISPWNTPEIQSDGSGGAIYSWYDAPSLSIFNSWVQHIDAGGNMLFPMNGAQASTNSADRLHMSPSATCNGSDIFMFWVEENGNQDQYGLYGQKFSSTGDRLWTDNGLELLPLGPIQIWSLQTLAVNNGVYIGYLIDPLNTTLRTIRTDYDGSVLWGPSTLSAADLGGKGDLNLCIGNTDSAFFTWEDDRNESGIYAQNIDPEGNMGPYMGIGSDLLNGENQSLINLSSNPASNSLNINLSLPFTDSVSLEVYDITGRLTRSLISGELGMGEHSVNWDLTDQSGNVSSPGMYLIKFSCGAENNTAKVIIL